MQKDLSLFFQVINCPTLLLKFKDNEVLATYCKLVTDDFITFPKIDIKDLKYHGYPNDEYQVGRYNNFIKNILPQILNSNTEKQKELMCEFLESCHGDDSTRDSVNNVHQPEYLFYYHIFSKSHCIPFNIIYKAYPELQKASTDFTYPCIGYKIPTGTMIEIEFKNNNLRFKDVQNSNIQLDFLRLPFRKSFNAKIVISPKWFKYDINYYRNRNAKWQELRIKGIKTKDIKIYILYCSRTKEWLRETLEKIGVKAIVLNPIKINDSKDIKEALIECCKKEYRAILINNDIYVAKKTKAKMFKIDSQIPSNSFPWDLNAFNIHYSLIPEVLL